MIKISILAQNQLYIEILKFYEILNKILDFLFNLIYNYIVHIFIGIEKMEEIKEFLENQLLEELTNKQFTNKVSGKLILSEIRRQFLLLTIGKESIVYDETRDELFVYTDFRLEDGIVKFSSAMELYQDFKQTDVYKKYRIDEAVNELLICLGFEEDEEEYA